MSSWPWAVCVCVFGKCIWHVAHSTHSVNVLFVRQFCTPCSCAFIKRESDDGILPCEQFSNASNRKCSRSKTCSLANKSTLTEKAFRCVCHAILTCNECVQRSSCETISGFIRCVIPFYSALTMSATKSKITQDPFCISVARSRSFIPSTSEIDSFDVRP